MSTLEAQLAPRRVTAAAQLGPEVGTAILGRTSSEGVSSPKAVLRQGRLHLTRSERTLQAWAELASFCEAAPAAWPREMRLLSASALL